jgi:hypothetical protein
VLFGDFAEAQPRNFGEVIDEEDFAEDYGYSSDSDLEDEEDQLRALQNTPTQDTTQSEVQDPSDSLAISSGDKIVYEDHAERVERGKVAKIPDVAFVT